MVDKPSASRKVFLAFDYCLMVCICLICLLPIWHVIMASISEPALVDMNKGFLLWPLGTPSLNAYSVILQYKGFWQGYLNTLCYVIAQVLLTTSLTLMAAYVVSRKQFRYRSAVMRLITFTMMFNGGMVPTFMLVRNLGMLNTYWSQLLPMALSAFYIIIARSAIDGVPESLAESARIDGAGELTIMVRIVLPVIKSTIAVIVLFVAVAKWNEWFPALLYLPKAADKYPLQMHLRQILIQAEDATNAAALMDDSQLYKTLAKYATIVVSTLPILTIYPFVQKYFVTGVTIGSVKG